MPLFAAMSCRALLSVLGVPGWGNLHLHLPAPADPQALAARLRRSLLTAGLNAEGRGLPAGQVVAALLRHQDDLQPLLLPLRSWCPAGVRYRYLLLCRRGGGPLHVAVLQRSLPGRGWQRRVAARPLAVFLGGHPAVTGCRQEPSGRQEPSAHPGAPPPTPKMDSHLDSPWDAVGLGLRLSSGFGR